MASGSDERRYDPTDKAREQAYTLKEFQDFFEKKGYDEEWILARWARSPSAGLPLVATAAPKIEAKEESSASEEEPAKTTKSAARLKRQKQKKRELKAGAASTSPFVPPATKGQTQLQLARPTPLPEGASHMDQAPKRAKRDVPDDKLNTYCLLYTSPSPRDPKTSRMPSSA